MQVINKLGQPHSGSPICLIMSVITDQIGWHNVLLPIINHNRYNFQENKRIPSFVKDPLNYQVSKEIQIHLFWKTPSLVGSVFVAMVIAINYVIGGLNYT